MFIDTHTHLYSEEFKIDIDEVLKKAIDAGVEFFLRGARYFNPIQNITQNRKLVAMPISTGRQHCLRTSGGSPATRAAINAMMGAASTINASSTQ